MVSLPPGFTGKSSSNDAKFSLRGKRIFLPSSNCKCVYYRLHFSIFPSSWPVVKEDIYFFPMAVKVTECERFSRGKLYVYLEAIC